MVNYYNTVSFYFVDLRMHKGAFGIKEYVTTPPKKHAHKTLGKIHSKSTVEKSMQTLRKNIWVNTVGRL